MGVPVNIIDNETTEFDANCAVDLANKIYEQVKKEEAQNKKKAIIKFIIM